MQYLHFRKCVQCRIREFGVELGWQSSWQLSRCWEEKCSNRRIIECLRWQAQPEIRFGDAIASTSKRESIKLNSFYACSTIESVICQQQGIPCCGDYWGVTALEECHRVSGETLFHIEWWQTIRGPIIMRLEDSPYSDENQIDRWMERLIKLECASTNLTYFAVKLWDHLEWLMARVAMSTVAHPTI